VQQKITLQGNQNAYIDSKINMTNSAILVLCGTLNWLPVSCSSTL